MRRVCTSQPERMAPRGLSALGLAPSHRRGQMLERPFAGFPAKVEAILPNDCTSVGVSLFGRMATIVLDAGHIQKI